jgi:hypothetical protein
MDLELIIAGFVGVGSLLGIGVVVHRLWLAATNPALAYRAGRKLRRGVESTARTAGRASGAVGGVASVVGRSFREGRDASKGKRRGSGSGS